MHPFTKTLSQQNNEERGGGFALLRKEERPREKIAAYGAGVLSDAELLAIFLRTGKVGRSVLEVAQDLLVEWGSLRRLAGCSLEELSQISGIGFAKASELKAAFEMGKRMVRPQEEGYLLKTGKDIYDLMAPELQDLPYESLWVLLLNVRYRLLEKVEISRGSLTQSIAHPREIFRPALAKRAYAVALVHNHPSGNPLPSEADRMLTRKLSQASDILQVMLLDHVIIGAPSLHRSPYFSFYESGLLG
jgi:DNA repair protein RadC